MDKMYLRGLDAGSVVSFGGVEVMLSSQTWVFTRDEDREAINAAERLERTMRAPRTAELAKDSKRGRTR